MTNSTKQGVGNEPDTFTTTRATNMSFTNASTLAEIDFGPSNTTRHLHDVAARFVNKSNMHLLKRDEYYCLRARFDGCWAGVLIGETEQEVRAKIPEVMALLPGATFEFGHNRKSDDYENDFAWHETILPL